jgi:LysR family transcriptional regulator, glycine cleavage system transcriptional activator
MSLLVAFEAAARHRSFTRAGQELSLTQSAVSRQVQALENLLNVKLFRRSGRQIALTELGTMYANDVAFALSRIRTASSQLLAFGAGGGSLNLASLPTFGSRWLMPLMPGFYERHQGLMVHLHARIGRYDLSEAGMDAMINVGDGQWPGMLSHALVDESPLLVASPALMERMPIARPADVAAHTLLQVSTRAEEWRQWFVLHKLSSQEMRAGPYFELTLHLIEAVVAGIGIGLVSRCLVERELASGALVTPLPDPPPNGRAYYLVYPPEKAVFPPLAAFRDWLLPHASPQS